MKIYNSLNIDNACRSVALGYFDAVHLGHRNVIESAVSYAKENSLESTVFTFSLSAELSIKGKEVLQPCEKQSRIKALGVQCYVCPPFDTLFGLSPQQFVRDILHKALNAKAVFCGSNYTFGAKKAGNPQLLKQLCAEFEIKVFIVDLQAQNGEDISASRIRLCLENGEIDEACRLMGQPYSITLPVVHGKALGKTIGVPTINQLFTDNMQIPKSGVYATRLLINGKYYAGATGIGSRPTVGGKGVTCETFISGFDGDLYGHEIRLEFLQYLFETKKYRSLDELKACILQAAQASLKLNNL